MIDLDTGELLEEGVPVWVGRRKLLPYTRFMVTNQNVLEVLATRRDVTGETLRVFMYLGSQLEFENLIAVKQTDVAEALGMRRQNVNRAFRKLEELGVILRGPKVGASSSWKLALEAGWKGTGDELRRKLRLIEGGKAQDQGK